MFECTLCQKKFTRKDSLLRHLRTVHMDFSKYTDKNIMVQSAPNLFDERGSSDADNMILSIEDENSVNSYNDNGNKVANVENHSGSDNSEPESNTLDQRITTARQAIQSKFDSLKGQCSAHDFENENAQKKNIKGTSSIPNLTGLLQTALDILLIKELQRQNGKHDRDNLKSMQEEKQEEQPQIKRFKHDNYMYSKNADNNKVIKYWHNPNTLVERLKNLTTATDTGQQIFTILQHLNKNNIKNVSFFEYIRPEKERDELIKNLSELKKTDIGQEIISIINELEKAEYIEPISDNLSLLRHDGELDNDENEEESDSDNQIDDVNKKTTIGNGLYIRPYKRS